MQKIILLIILSSLLITNNLDATKKKLSDLVRKHLIGKTHSERAFENSDSDNDYELVGKKSRKYSKRVYSPENEFEDYQEKNKIKFKKMQKVAPWVGVGTLGLVLAVAFFIRQFQIG